MTFGLAWAADETGIAQKWVTAIMVTLIPFGLVTFLRRRYLGRSYWLALAVCLVLHCLIIGAIFQYLFASFQRVSPILWLPVMLLEIFVLIIAVKRIEERITGRHETRSCCASRSSAGTY